MTTTIVTIDTTGLLDRIPGWGPRVVAVGVAQIEDGLIVGSAGTLVQQSAAHVFDERAAPAFRVSGILPESVVKSPHDEEDVMRRLRSVPLGTVTGFNLPFLRDMLSLPPWDRLNLSWGSCVMAEAARVVHGGQRINLNAALTWAAERGADLLPPKDATLRCHANAVRIAKLKLELDRCQR